MKILLFGRGVIATQYAWALENAGHDITFYVRPEKLQSYGGSISLNLLDGRKSKRGKSVKTSWQVKMIGTIPENHDYDLIVVSVQHYNFKAAADFLSTRIGDATVLIFNNFWREPLVEAAALPSNQLVWGFPRAGGGFDDKDVLTGAFLGSIAFGTFKTLPGERHQQVVSLFEKAGFKTEFYNDFRSWLFIHFAFSAARQLESFKDANDRSPVKRFQSLRFWKEVLLSTKELIPLLEARKVDLTASPELKVLENPAILKMAVRITRPVRVILDAHANPDELKTICRDVSQTGKEINIPLKRFEAADSNFLN